MCSFVWKWCSSLFQSNELLRLFLSSRMPRPLQSSLMSAKFPSAFDSLPLHPTQLGSDFTRTYSYYIWDRRFRKVAARDLEHLWLSLLQGASKSAHVAQENQQNGNAIQHSNLQLQTFHHRWPCIVSWLWIETFTIWYLLKYILWYGPTEC